MELTKEQQDWFKHYENETGFDVLEPADNMTFERIAQFNIDWYESHAGEVLRRIGNFPKSQQYWDDFLKN